MCSSDLLVALKLLHPSRELAEQHYAVHKERPFFGGLVEFMTSGPVVAMIWQGDGVVAASRLTIGATNPLVSPPGTIRGDWAGSNKINQTSKKWSFFMNCVMLLG